MSSLLIFTSSIKSKYIKYISFVLLAICLIITLDFKNNLLFNIVNVSVIALIVFVNQSIRNKRANAIMSILSKVVYSIIIDTICYFWWQLFTINQNYIEYIISGLLFNLKDIVFSTIVYATIFMTIKMGETKYESSLITY